MKSNKAKTTLAILTAAVLVGLTGCESHHSLGEKSTSIEQESDSYDDSFVSETVFKSTELVPSNGYQKALTQSTEK